MLRSRSAWCRPETRQAGAELRKTCSCLQPARVKKRLNHWPPHAPIEVFLPGWPAWMLRRPACIHRRAASQPGPPTSARPSCWHRLGTALAAGSSRSAWQQTRAHLQGAQINLGGASRYADGSLQAGGAQMAEAGSRPAASCQPQPASQLPGATSRRAHGALPASWQTATGAPARRGALGRWVRPAVLGSTACRLRESAILPVCLLYATCGLVGRRAGRLELAVWLGERDTVNCDDPLSGCCAGGCDGRSGGSRGGC
jgi:hypothetical protein